MIEKYWFDQSFWARAKQGGHHELIFQLLVEGQVNLPLGPAAANDPNPVPALCPDPVTAFGSEFYPTLDAKKLAKGKVNPSEFLFDCPRWHLCLDTETLHAKKWSGVPGAKWVNYTRPLETPAMSLKPKPTDRAQPTIARFLLDGPVLPLLTDTILVAEVFRHELLKRFQRHRYRQEYGRVDKPYKEKFRSEVLSGKDVAGVFLREHRHAFYLPTAEGQDPRWITHVTVAATAGFGPDEVAALNSLRALKWDSEGPELRVQLVGLGTRTDFRAPLLGESTVWTSATPFVVTRYPKLRGTKRDQPADYASPRHFTRYILKQELERRSDLPPIEAIEEEECLGPEGLRLISFKRFRRKAGDDGGRRPAGGFRIAFQGPVQGPLCLGHSCHFGLGMFLPSPGSQREGN